MQFLNKLHNKVFSTKKNSLIRSLNALHGTNNINKTYLDH